MESSELTIKVLEGIQATLVGLREDVGGLRADTNARVGEVNERLAQHGERLDRLERHAAVASETLVAMNERMAFFERIATASMEGRSRLDDRVDRLEARMDALETRGEPGEG